MNFNPWFSQQKSIIFWEFVQWHWSKFLEDSLCLCSSRYKTVPSLPKHWMMFQHGQEGPRDEKTMINEN